MWIWSISIPSERERRVASFIISFLDCISHTYEVPLLSGNLSWHVKFHTEITHQFTFSPKVDMSPNTPEDDAYLFVLADQRVWVSLERKHFHIEAKCATLTLSAK